MAQILVDTTDMPREEWLKYRRSGIGGSDAAVICGLSDFTSKIELWADKTGRLPEKEDTEKMRIGRDLEEYVAQRFCEATGKTIEMQNTMFKHDDYDFITANVDRKVVGENAGLECKTTSAFAKSDFENGEIPQYYYCQCMHYMNVMGFEKMYLAVLVLGKAFYWFEIPYDKKEGEALLALEVNFWNNYIVPDIRPEPDGSESSERVIETLFEKRRKNTITLFEQEDIAQQLSAIKIKKKILENEEKRLQQLLINALETSTDGVTLNYAISYTPQSRTNIDSKKLQKLFPDVYEQVKYNTCNNIFRIKERKEKR